MLYQGRVGHLTPGSKAGNYTLQRMDLWNAWDDLALIKGLIRRPNESNLLFRQRILLARNYGAAPQQLANWLCDSFDLTRYIMVGRRIFFSAHVPLSYIQYLTLADPTVAYMAPQVVADGTAFQFPVDDIDVAREPVAVDAFDGDGNVLKYAYSYEKTEIYAADRATKWTLWKNIDQSYFPIWESSAVPAEFLLRYQTVIDGTLFTIEESAKGLTRDENGNIILR